MFVKIIDGKLCHNRSQKLAPDTVAINLMPHSGTSFYAGCIWHTKSASIYGVEINMVEE